MNQEILDEASEIMKEYREEKVFSEEARKICDGAALNKIAKGERQSDDNKQRTD